jgi:hypothetical protein
MSTPSVIAPAIGVLATGLDGAGVVATGLDGAGVVATGLGSTGMVATGLGSAGVMATGSDRVEVVPNDLGVMDVFDDIVDKMGKGTGAEFEDVDGDEANDLPTDRIG